MKVLFSTICFIFIWAFAFEASRPLAMRLEYIGLFPGWLYYFVPFATAIFLNPWHYFISSPLHLFSPTMRFVRTCSVIALTMAFWGLLIWETHRKVITVDFIKGLSLSNMSYLYDSLGCQWTYNPKKGILYIPRGSLSELTKIKDFRQSLLMKSDIRKESFAKESESIDK
jgi:hypothetical protein